MLRVHKDKFRIATKYKQKESKEKKSKNPTKN